MTNFPRLRQCAGMSPEAPARACSLRSMVTPGPEDWDRWIEDENYDYASWSDDQARHLSTVELFQGHAGARFVPLDVRSEAERRAAPLLWGNAFELSQLEAGEDPGLPRTEWPIVFGADDAETQQALQILKSMGYETTTAPWGYAWLAWYAGRFPG